MLEFTFIKNHLLENQFNERDRQVLEEVKEKIKASKTNPFKDLVLDAIENCEQDIQKSDWNSAAREMDFIHLLPLINDDLSGWYEERFYSVELLKYIENVKDYTRVKKVINRLAELQKNLERK